MYYSLYTYFWKIRQKREYNTIINDFNYISEGFKAKGLINENYSRKEITNEIYRLREWRVIARSIGSAYYSLRKEVKEKLDRNEDKIERISQGDDTRKVVIEIIQNCLERED